MGFDTENAFQHAMCIELSPTTLTYAIIHTDTKKSVAEKSVTLSDFNKATIDEILKDDIFKADYKSVSLSVSTPRHTLVPVSIFNTSKPLEIFKLNHQSPFEDIDYNRIPELGIVSIYELPLWIKSAFVIKIPRIKIIHTSTTLLKGVFNKPVFSPKAHVFWQDDAFYLVLTSKSKVEYFNRFDTSAIEDLVYYLLFVTEQKELNLSDMQINLYGVNLQWEHLKSLKDLLQQPIKVEPQKEQSELFILTNQLLCV